MRISLLGPLRVDEAAGEVVFRAAKERSLLAALALHPGNVVSSDALVAALWGEDPPGAARKTLQTYVWNLRKALGAAVIETVAPGYVLRIAPDDVDVGRFRRLVGDGAGALKAGQVGRARSLLGEALELWRGPPFGGVAAHTGLAGEAVRLTEEHMSALEARVAADLAAGVHVDLVGELEVLVRTHPFRERLWGHLMVAQYRCGRQADALATYQRARTVLTEELGLEPGGELQRLESAILNHDPSMTGPPDDAVGPSPPDPTVRTPVRFVRSADGTNIAYQVAGDGPLTVLAIAGFVSHLDIWWNAPTDGLVRRLTSMARLVVFDKRGMGLSDRPERVDAEDWVDDAVAVLDAVGVEQAVVLGVSAGATTALRLTVRHPARVQALVLHGGSARTMADDDYDIGFDRETVESFAENLERGWGTGVAISWYAPSRAHDPGVRDYWARYQLLSASPSSAIRFFWASVEIDVRDALGEVHVPTLIVHPARDIISPISHAQYMAERIPGAEFITLDSDVHLICISDVLEELADALEGFIARLDQAPSSLGASAAGASHDAVFVTAVSVRGCSPSLLSATAEVIASWGGVLQGGGLTATFSSPGAAIGCAARLGREAGGAAAAGGDSSGDGQLRIGVHAGECRAVDGGYEGVAVNVADRLAGDASPGEVLLTATVRDVVAGRRLSTTPRGTIEMADTGTWEVLALTIGVGEPSNHLTS